MGPLKWILQAWARMEQADEGEIADAEYQRRYAEAWEASRRYVARLQHSQPAAPREEVRCEAEPEAQGV